MILYERWLTVLDRFRHEVAVVDAACGEMLTFDELAALAAAVPMMSAGTWCATSLREGLKNFLAKALACWRDETVFCPVEGELPQVAPPPKDLAGVCHAKLTSGSTGEPRMVLFTAEQLAADCDHIWTTMGLRRDWPNVAVVSAAHSYGFANIVLPLFLYGQPLRVCPDPLPGTLRSVLQAAQGPVTLPAVPAMWRAWSQSGVLDGASVALAISAGAPLPVELEQQIYCATGIKVHNFYGSSECGGIAFDRSEEPRTDSSLAGTAMDGVQLTVGADGSLHIASAAVGCGYWPAPKNAESLADGCFVSTDTVELLPTGEVRLLGRVSDVINVAGRKLAPVEVEAALLRHAAVRHCVVFGIPSADPARVEDVVACVHAAPDTDPRDLMAAISKELTPWQCPRHWWITQELLPDARGKTSRAAWRRRFLERR